MEAEAEMESGVRRVSLTDPAAGTLRQNRQFLDYFWDIIKPEREVRLRAVENLLNHLRSQQQSDELKFTLKRLVDGLCHNREEARSGYSLALSQVLSVFEEISLKKVLDQIKEKHNLQTASKKQIRTVVFGNFFGVLALSQSNRLHKEVEVMLECVKILQVLSQYKDHLRDLPRRTLSDLLNEVSEQQFEQVLYGALQDDMSSALSDPQHLELLLLAMRRFTSTLNPTRLKQLLGTSSIINTHTLPRLVEVVKMAVRSGKVGVMPPVVSDLLAASLRENSFDLFWNTVVIDNLISEPPGPSHYLAFRVMGAALPQLSLSQLRVVLSSEVMRQYGEHALSAQLPGRFKFSPEMDVCVAEFMRSCSDADKQVEALQAFSRLSFRGAPVVPSYWKVLEQTQPAALARYVLWLQQQFCHPEMETLVEFSTRKQRQNPEPHPETESSVCRFRKWIIPRLTCILENQQIKKEEELIMSIARFIFFHAFFETVRPTAHISETQVSISPPLEQNTRSVACSAFYSVLQAVNVLPGRGETGGGRGQVGLMGDGSLWVYQLVQFANKLLKDHKHTQSIQTFNTQHTQAWDSMLESVESLRKKSKRSSSPEHTAFQHLFLIVSIHMFKAADDSVELLNDLHSCLEKAQAKNLKQRKKKVDAGGEQGEEPHWVEVVVEILLSLLAQPSRLIRNVCRSAFSRICPHLTPSALTAILSVLDPSTDEEESSMMVTEEEGEKKSEDEEEEEVESDSSDGDDDEDDYDDVDDDEDDDDDVMEEEQEPVDQNFRLELMKVLQGHNAPTTEGGDDDDDDDEEEEELDDEAMMKLDQNLASLFGAQKKKMQEKKDEKERARKEKSLVRDFKTKVLDLVQVYLQKQGSSRLVMMMVEPLLSIIENSMSSESNQQEQDFLRRAAHIFRNDLCRGKHYCREVEGRGAELHDMLERLIGRAQKLSDSSVSLYYFSAALYVLKVLRGVLKDPQEPDQEMMMGKVDVQRVTSCFREALCVFMKRRHSPLTADMFIDLFNRFPVLCVNLLDTLVENISGGVREHQQGQACVMVLKALQAREVKQLMSDAQRLGFCQNIVLHVSQTLQREELKNKAVHERTLKALELCHGLIKTINSQKLEVDLKELQNVLKAMNADGVLQKSGRLEDTYWSVLKLLGVQKPQVEKVRKTKGEEQKDQEVPKKKKKGFLPETKKRKNRKKPIATESQSSTATPGAPDGDNTGAGGGEAAPSKKKKKKRKQKKKGGAGGESAQGQPPTKRTKVQPQQDEQESKQKKKKKKKKGVEVSAE